MDALIWTISSYEADPTFHPTFDAAQVHLQDLADAVAGIPRQDRADRRRWSWMARPGDRTINGWPLDGVGRVRIGLNMARRRLRIHWVENGNRVWETHWLVPLKTEGELRDAARPFIKNQQDFKVEDIVRMLLEI